MKKYLKNKFISEVKWKVGDSHFWSVLMKVKDRFLHLSTLTFIMVLRLGSGRIYGLKTLLSKNNAHLYTTFVERNIFQ